MARDVEARQKEIKIYFEKNLLTHSVSLKIRLTIGKCFDCTVLDAYIRENHFHAQQKATMCMNCVYTKHNLSQDIVIKIEIQLHRRQTITYILNAWIHITSIHVHIFIYAKTNVQKCQHNLLKHFH